MSVCSTLIIFFCRTLRSGLFIGRFSEIWGFWRFYLEFWVNFWVFEQFCLILDKICYMVKYLLLKKLPESSVLGEKFLSFWVFLAWLLVFSFWVLEQMSKKQAWSMMNVKLSQQGFWHCYGNGLYCGLRLILVYPNPQ